MITEREFSKACDAAPHHLRADIYQVAWESAWSAEAYYECDSERWAAAIEAAERIIDALADYGLTS